MDAEGAAYGISFGTGYRAAGVPASAAEQYDDYDPKITKLFVKMRATTERQMAESRRLHAVPTKPVHRHLRDRGERRKPRSYKDTEHVLQALTSAAPRRSSDYDSDPGSDTHAFGTNTRRHRSRDADGDDGRDAEDGTVHVGHREPSLTPLGPPPPRARAYLRRAEKPDSTSSDQKTAPGEESRHTPPGSPLAPILQASLQSTASSATQRALTRHKPDAPPDQPSGPGLFLVPPLAHAQGQGLTSFSRSYTKMDIDPPSLSAMSLDPPPGSEVDTNLNLVTERSREEAPPSVPAESDTASASSASEAQESEEYLTAAPTLLRQHRTRLEPTPRDSSTPLARRPVSRFLATAGEETVLPRTGSLGFGRLAQGEPIGLKPVPSPGPASFVVPPPSRSPPAQPTLQSSTLPWGQEHESTMNTVDEDTVELRLRQRATTLTPRPTRPSPLAAVNSDESDADSSPIPVEGSTAVLGPGQTQTPEAATNWPVGAEDKSVRFDKSSLNLVSPSKASSEDTQSSQSSEDQNDPWRTPRTPKWTRSTSVPRAQQPAAATPATAVKTPHPPGFFRFKPTPLRAVSGPAALQSSTLARMPPPPNDPQGEALAASKGNSTSVDIPQNVNHTPDSSPAQGSTILVHRIPGGLPRTPRAPPRAPHSALAYTRDSPQRPPPAPGLLARTPLRSAFAPSSAPPTSVAATPAPPGKWRFSPCPGIPAKVDHPPRESTPPPTPRTRSYSLSQSAVTAPEAEADAGEASQPSVSLSVDTFTSAPEGSRLIAPSALRSKHHTLPLAQARSLPQLASPPVPEPANDPAILAQSAAHKARTVPAASAADVTATATAVPNALLPVHEKEVPVESHLQKLQLTLAELEQTLEQGQPAASHAHERRTSLVHPAVPPARTVAPSMPPDTGASLSAVDDAKLDAEVHRARDRLLRLASGMEPAAMSPWHTRRRRYPRILITFCIALWLLLLSSRAGAHWALRAYAEQVAFSPWIFHPGVGDVGGAGVGAGWVWGSGSGLGADATWLDSLLLVLSPLAPTRGYWGPDLDASLALIVRTLPSPSATGGGSLFVHALVAFFRGKWRPASLLLRAATTSWILLFHSFFHPHTAQTNPRALV